MIFQSLLSWREKATYIIQKSSFAFEIHEDSTKTEYVLKICRYDVKPSFELYKSIELFQLK